MLLQPRGQISQRFEIEQHIAEFFDLCQRQRADVRLRSLIQHTKAPLQLPQSGFHDAHFVAFFYAAPFN